MFTPARSKRCESTYAQRAYRFAGLPPVDSVLTTVTSPACWRVQRAVRAVLMFSSVREEMSAAVRPLLGPRFRRARILSLALRFVALRFVTWAMLTFLVTRWGNGSPYVYGHVGHRISLYLARGVHNALYSELALQLREQV